MEEFWVDFVKFYLLIIFDMDMIIIVMVVFEVVVVYVFNEEYIVEWILIWM